MNDQHNLTTDLKDLLTHWIGERFQLRTKAPNGLPDALLGQLLQDSRGSLAHLLKSMKLTPPLFTYEQLVRELDDIQAKVRTGIIDAGLMLDQMIPIPEKERDPDQTQDQAAKWVNDKVFIGLCTLVNSQLKDWTALEQAAEGLPRHLRHAWGQLITVSKSERILKKDEDGFPNMQRFMRVVRFVNEQWMVPQKLYLGRDNVGDQLADSLGMSQWQRLRMGIYDIRTNQNFSFHDESVRCITVMPIYLYPDCKGERIAYDPTQEYAIISLPGLYNNTERFMTWAAGGEASDDLDRCLMTTGGETRAGVDTWKDYAQHIVARHPVALELHTALTLRTTLEEIRHGIDSKRVRTLIGKDVPPTEYSIRFSELMLSQGGKLHNFLPPEEDEEDRIEFASIVSEMSAQITAGAMGPDPMLMVAEWRRAIKLISHPDFDVNKETYSLAHTRASLEILTMLGLELGLLEQEDAALNELEEIVKKLLNVSNQLLVCDEDKIRNALKNIYAREFVLGQIDEGVFKNLKAAVTLGPKPGA